ncbi:hypothetical protein SH449x_001215 [Pirellulaceae bacterium SH449]
MRKLAVDFSQFYFEPGASYHFSGRFLSQLQRRISRKMLPSEKFSKEYSNVCKLCFYIDASAKIDKGIVRFTDYDARRTEAEFRLILPYSASDRIPKRRTASGVKHLVDTLGMFFRKFDMNVPEEWCKTEIVALFLDNFESYVYDNR